MGLDATGDATIIPLMSNAIHLPALLSATHTAPANDNRDPAREARSAAIRAAEARYEAARLARLNGVAK